MGCALYELDGWLGGLSFLICEVKTWIPMVWCYFKDQNDSWRHRACSMNGSHYNLLMEGGNYVQGSRSETTSWQWQQGPKIRKRKADIPRPPASLFHLRSDPAETLTGCSCDILKGCLMAVPSVIKQQTVYYCLALSLFLVGARKGRGCHRMMYGPQDKRPVHQCLTSRA